LSLTLELLQASIESRVPSYTDLTLNSAGTLVGALAGSAWHAFGSRITPQDNPQSHSRAVTVTIVALWLMTRLWPLVPDLGLRQVKAAVKPLLDPSLSAMELAGLLHRVAHRRPGARAPDAPAARGRCVADHRSRRCWSGARSSPAARSRLQSSWRSRWWCRRWCR
jgi:hypothetical protein